MIPNQEGIGSLFSTMMEGLEEITTDAIYQEDMKDLESLRVQWEICGIFGYQIFAKDTYSHKFGETLDDPDIALAIADNDSAIQFLKGEPFSELSPVPTDEKGKFNLLHTVGWEIIDTDKGKKRSRITKPLLTARFSKEKRYHPFVLLKLPMFRDLIKKQWEDEEEYGVYVPINRSLGTFENEVLPLKVFKHFIDKATNIVMLNNCPCRVFNNCPDHDKSIGCMLMGADTLEMLIAEDRGSVVTKEEALERVRLAVDDGLIPLLGRAMSEAEGYGVPDTGHFLSMCFCCPCCCVNGKILSLGSLGLSIFHRMEGVRVEVDEDLCIGCEECLEVCAFKGMEMIDEMARVNDERCLGCGRCESACAEEAISITIDESGRVDELIGRIGSYVDVT